MVSESRRHAFLDLDVLVAGATADALLVLD